MIPPRPGFFAAWLRLSRPRDWATSKVPFLLASVLWAGTGSGSASCVVAMVAAIAALAAFGYGVNEIADRSSDTRAGKANRAIPLSRMSAGLFLILTSTASGVVVATRADDLRAPLLWLSAVALSVAYSAPPLRLKERGLVGIAAAAAAQWSLPVLFASAACDERALGADSWILALLGLAIGIRWMAVHQLADVSRDRASGVRTYASSGGAVAKLPSWALLAEIALLLAGLIASWPRSAPAWVALVPFALQSRLAPGAGAPLRDRIVTYERAPLSGYYFLFLPLSLSLGRASSDPEFLVVAAIVILLGAGQITRLLREWRPAGT